MKIEPPKVGTRWYKFSDPANKARIVQVTALIPSWPRKVPCLVEVHPEIDGLFHWDPADFVREFRPL